MNLSNFADSYKADPKSKVLLDVRNPDETNSGTLMGSCPIPLPELEMRCNEIPIDSNIYIYCKSGGRAEKAAIALESKGYQKIFFATDGGYEDLKKLF